MKSKKKTCFKLKNRRAITDIISTLMLMAVTVTGATTLTYFMNDAFVSGNLGTVTTLESSSMNLLLLAYDTRDSNSLLTLSDVDNENTVNRFLCGVTCSSSSYLIPENGGTEFIVLMIQNNGIDSIFLKNILVNDVRHNWDPATANILLNTSQNDLVGGKYPQDGMFSILPEGVTPIIQNESFKIDNGSVVYLLIKLGPEDSDISLNKGIRISLNTGAIHPVEFLIESGDAR